ncbi:uncharacterized protein C1orf159 homolog isoform X3 [Amblyraja radiata]|uniref:uncharacterized protein C1orf159 homolog isoform X3 n=1 Tax=Amblyraja radiata TaxID=386614 RepID=UPI0014032DBF|nr:uncharacterized protein C1orf159 homolog isoform X3 [Amblyraja radiata]
MPELNPFIDQGLLLMRPPFAWILVRFVLGIFAETPQSLISPAVRSGCCVDLVDEFGFCPQRSFCNPDCYRQWFKNGSSTCLRCVNGTSTYSSTNQTGCVNLSSSSEGRGTNGTTVGPTTLKTDSILQPSEVVGMVRSSVGSVRKQRYSRRERLSASVTLSASTAMNDV